MIHIQGTWVWFYPIRECIPSLEYFRFALSRAHAENVFQSVFRRPPSCYCNCMFSADQVRYTKTSVVSNMIYSSSFESALIFQNITPQKKAFQLALEIKRKEIYWISSQSHMLYLASPKFSWREVCLHDNSTANSSWELENTMVKKTFHQSGQRINPQIEWASQSK